MGLVAAGYVVAGYVVAGKVVAGNVAVELELVEYVFGRLSVRWLVDMPLCSRLRTSEIVGDNMWERWPMCGHWQSK